MCGYEDPSDLKDIKFTYELFEQFISNNFDMHRVIDIGCGIGRVVGDVLKKFYTTIDLLD